MKESVSSAFLLDVEKNISDRLSSGTREGFRWSGKELGGSDREVAISGAVGRAAAHQAVRVLAQHRPDALEADRKVQLDC